MEEEDREMASVIARSEGEHAKDSDKQEQAGGELSQMIRALFCFSSLSCPFLVQLLVLRRRHPFPKNRSRESLQLDSTENGPLLNCASAMAMQN